MQKIILVGKPNVGKS
ncbi:hypothetical protein H740_07519, partial [Campylobacter showae CC57C]